jgi:hypothetical protein
VPPTPPVLTQPKEVGAPLTWDDIDADPELGPDCPPPTAEEDVDEISIDRAIAGDGIRLANPTLAQQQNAIRHLTQGGRSASAITGARPATWTSFESTKTAVISWVARGHVGCPCPSSDVTASHVIAGDEGIRPQLIIGTPDQRSSKAPTRVDR